MAGGTCRTPAAQAAPPTITPAYDDTLAATLASLSALDLTGLRQLWRRRLGGRAPAHLPRSLLSRLLAYKLQAQVMGDLSLETARLLDRLAREEVRARRSAAAGQGRGAGLSTATPPGAVPSTLVPPVPEPAGLRPGGDRLIRGGGPTHSADRNRSEGRCALRPCSPQT